MQDIPEKPPEDSGESFALFLAMTMGMVLVACVAYINLQPWAHSDWDHYYGTSWLILHGIQPYGELFSSHPALQIFDVDPYSTIGMATNPPPLAAFLAPLGLFNERLGWCLWIAINCLTLVYGIVSLGENTGLWTRPKATHFFILAVPLSFPMTDGMGYSQISSFLCGILMLAWVAHRKNNHVLCAVLITASILFKVYPWPLAYLLFCGNWKIRLGSAAVTGLILFSLPLLVIGPHCYQDWLEKAYPLIHHWELYGRFNLSLPHVLQPFLGTRGGTLLCQSAVLAAGAFAWWRIRKNLPPSYQLYDFGVVAILSAACAPVAWSHYFVFLFLGLIAAFPFCGRHALKILAVVWLGTFSILTLQILKLSFSQNYPLACQTVLFGAALALILIPIGLSKNLRSSFLPKFR